LTKLLHYNGSLFIFTPWKFSIDKLTHF